MLISEILTIPDESTTSNSIQVDHKGGMRLSSILCPAAFSGSLFRIEKKVKRNSSDVWSPMRSPGSGADFPYQFSVNGSIPIDADTARDLKDQWVRIVSATTQTSGPVTFLMQFSPV